MTRQHARHWLPFVACALCLALTSWTGPVLTYLLVVAAFAFALDGSTAMWARNGRVGGLTDHRQ